MQYAMALQQTGCFFVDAVECQSTPTAKADAQHLATGTVEAAWKLYKERDQLISQRIYLHCTSCWEDSNPPPTLQTAHNS